MNKKLFLVLSGIILVMLLLNIILGLTGSVSPSKYILSGEVGEKFNRSILIKNTNDVPVTVSLSTSSENIVASLSNVVLQPSESKYIPITVELVSIGTVNENIEIVFSDSINNVLFNTGVTLIATQAINSDVVISSELSPETPEAIAGEEIIVLAQLTNTGDIETDYVVSVRGHGSWAKLNLIENPEISLLPEETNTVIIHLNVNNNALGDKNFIIQADYNDKTKEDIVYINVIQRGVTDIGYIVKDSNRPNNKLISLINEMDYSYQIIDDSQIQNTDFRLYKMILVGDERISGVPVDSYRTLVINPDYYSSFSSSKGSTTKSNLYLKDEDIIIAQNIPKDFYAYSSPSKTLNYLTGQKYSRSIVTAGSSAADKGKYVLAVKENPRRVFFGATDVNYWSEESSELFKNSLFWVVNGEDKDGDGYFSDVDCNDNNPLLWKNINAYVDFDRDTFGGGNILKVCIGNELISGFSYVGGDCNDIVAVINPSAVEIPHNPVDENCDGYILNDIDGDGYSYEEDCDDEDSSVFQILIGYLDADDDKFGKGDIIEVCTGNKLPKGYSDNDLDCNDNNKNVYPGAFELLDNINQNCANDFPLLIGNIRDISWNEDSMYPGVIDLKEYIKDPDGDILTFEVYESDNDDIIININNGLVEFSSINNFNGESFVIFSGTDDDMMSVNSNEIKLIIYPENDNPEIINLDNFKVELDEDFGMYEFDLTEFMSDIDNEIEDLHWTIEYTSGEFVQSLNGNILILSSVEDKNCLDECGIMLRLIDKSSNLDRKFLNIKINPANDAPKFNGKISDISWNEDDVLDGFINLNDYFSDVDKDSLEFSFSGNSEISIEINSEAMVSFSSPHDWFGSESVIFLAQDSEYIVNSNEIILNVFDKEEPPIFEEMDCIIDVMEEEENECLLNASNFEDDPMSYQVVSEDNLDCEIVLDFENYLVKYSSYEDYFGEASCMIRVNDKDGFDDYVLTVNVLNINDAPKILTIDPAGKKIKVMNGTERLFSFFADDNDSSEIFVKWFLDSVEIDETEINNDKSYNFNKEIGTYELKLEVSDDFLSTENTWEVYVGTIHDFSCSEVSGYICSLDQVCSNGELLDVYDTPDCCSTTCSIRPPEFKSIKRKSNAITNDIYLEIKEISPDEKYYIGDNIPIDIKIENNDYSQDLDMEIHAYLYDITKEDVISNEKIKVNINKRSLRTQRFNLFVENDINVDNEFAIFVYSYSKEKDKVYYNEKYEIIDLSRRLHEIDIENVNVEPVRAVCGDTIFYRVKINNLGESDESFKINIESPGLGISKTESGIEIDSYGNSDSVIKDYIFTLPEKVSASEYTIRTKITYNNDADFKSDESIILLEECKNQDVEIIPVEKNPIKIENSPFVEEEKESYGRYAIYGVSLVMTLITFVVLVAGYRMIERKNKNTINVQGKGKGMRNIGSKNQKKFPKK